MENILKQLRENWVILFFIGTLIASWTMFSNRLTNAEGKVLKLETTYGQIQQIQIDVAVIKEKTSNENIKNQVRQGITEALANYEINP